MKWYPDLYVGRNASKRQKRIIRKLKVNAGLPEVYLITFAANETDIFDIISSVWLKQKAVRERLPEIIGIALGYKEAVELAAEIIMEAYRETGEIQIRKFLMKKGRKERI